MSVEELLVDALRAEYAAIYAYGVLGAHLSGSTISSATQADAAHRARRDALVTRLRQSARTAPASGTPQTRAEPANAPPYAEPAYTLPGPVTDQASALRLAILVEERTAVVWRAVLPESTGADRRLAVDALTDCAVRATRTRMVANITPATVSFPGRPES